MTQTPVRDYCLVVRAYDSCLQLEADEKKFQSGCTLYFYLKKSFFLFCHPGTYLCACHIGVFIMPPFISLISDTTTFYNQLAYFPEVFTNITVGGSQHQMTELCISKRDLVPVKKCDVCLQKIFSSLDEKIVYLEKRFGSNKEM